MVPKRHRRWLFDDMFGDFDEEFRTMEERMAKVVEEARKISSKKPDDGGPYVYGFSMRMGPDGKPHFEQFGNVPGPDIMDESIGLPEGREPLTDVIVGDKDVTVIAELPGIEKKDIKLSSTEKTMTIKVDTQKRKYFKELDLPAEVSPETSKASYKNGVLEVKMQLKEQKKKSKGVDLKVE